MESKIPLPTDNIYKFYALFGLVLLVTSIAAFVYVHKTTNEMAFEAYIEYEELDTKEHPTPVEKKRKELIEKRLEIAVKDRDFYNYAISALIGVGIFCVGFGFWKWETVVQPRQDSLLDLQIEKARHELKKPPRRPFRIPKE